MNYFSDEAEWQYLFRNAIDWKTILELYPADPNASKDEAIALYEELLANTGQWAAETLTPRARELDRVGGGTLVDHGVQVSDVLAATYQEAKGLDLFGLQMDPRHGGMGLPSAMTLLVFEQICRACVATGTQFGFFTTIADMIERFCGEDIQNKYLPKIRNGEISGCMCLTEPDAGSDVGALRTTAEKIGDGTYRLNGTKCFITNGGGGLSFILARVKDAPKGLEGISLFFAEEWLDRGDGNPPHRNYRITKIEEKMGMHGSPTCEVVYENTVARLVGAENEGFKIMLHLMNEARISVGLQGLAGIEAALAQVRLHAHQRKQFGKPLAELPLYERNLQDWETERDALRALLVDTVSHYEVFQRLDMKQRHAGELTEKEAKLFKKASKIVRRRTPLTKYYGTEANTHITQRAIQAFGGYGFMTEYDVERLHRDSFGPLIYEGTSQIQALMAMKDFIKGLMRDPAQFVQSLISSHPLAHTPLVSQETEFERKTSAAVYEFRKNVAALVMRCFKPELSLGEKGFMETVAQLQKVFRKEYWQDADRFDRLMRHAETLCQALSYLETLDVLARQAKSDSSRGDLFLRYHALVRPRLKGIYADWE